jgi:hypothetical protein
VPQLDSPSVLEGKLYPVGAIAAVALGLVLFFFSFFFTFFFEGGAARADGLGTDDAAFRFRSDGRLTADAGLTLALPTTLQTGLSMGAGGGVSLGRTFAWGLRGSWSSATESSLAWAVTHDDFRLRGTFAAQRRVGRGMLALRLGAGPTLIYERRVRNQGVRAGLTGSDLEASSLALAPAGELEGVVAVHVAGPWLFVLSGGPSLLILDGGAHLGWTTQLGVGWQP